MADDAVVTVVVKWTGTEYPIQLGPTETIADMKHELYRETGVSIEKQKILGLKTKAGKAAKDEHSMSELALKEGQKIMMMGTRDADMLQPPPDTDDTVVNDLEATEDEVAVQHRTDYHAKIARRVATYDIAELNAPRPGKKLLVLDIDYTLFDHRSVAESGRELMRPFLHEFLSAAYVHYDIVIWSATSMKWIQLKMKELGVLDSVTYKLTFMLCSRAMITVHAPVYGTIDIKPLGVIWAKYPDVYRPSNTIMFDDLRRNFLMNPQNGLRIRAFRDAHLNRETDTELLRLKDYLLAIAPLTDLSELDHRQWERYLRDRQ